MEENWLLKNFPQLENPDLRRALFSSFSKPREHNVEAHDAKVAFWTAVIRKLTVEGRSGSVFQTKDSDSLSSQLSIENLKPLGIAYVMV